MSYKTATLTVRVVLIEDAESDHVFSEMDYAFTHPDIVDYEIVDVRAPYEDGMIQ